VLYNNIIAVYILLGLQNYIIIHKELFCSWMDFKDKSCFFSASFSSCKEEQRYNEKALSFMLSLFLDFHFLSFSVPSNYVVRTYTMFLPHSEI